ncbi:MAG: immunoglobulin domain-containing protein [Ilyomonas sp.]
MKKMYLSSNSITYQIQKFDHPCPKTFIVYKAVCILVFVLLTTLVNAQSSTCFTDQTSTDFKVGSTNGATYISTTEDGEVILNPTIATEFDELPPVTEWNGFTWQDGGTFSISGSSLLVNASRFNSVAYFGPGTYLEFAATFGAFSNQHIGFGAGTDATSTGGIYSNGPWAMFSTFSSTTTLYARTSAGTAEDFSITGVANLIGSPHLFRIEWGTDNTFNYYIDGILVHTTTAVINVPMRPAISSFSNASISVDWIHVLPYSASGTFTSRVFDAGVTKVWGPVTWNANLPFGTALNISVRTGNTATPDGTWSDFTPVTSSGDEVGTNGRYIQYQASLSTTNTAFSPTLKNISFSCADLPAEEVPVVTSDPSSKTVCEGAPVTLSSSASGNPAPSVQWQVSTNGTDWNNIQGATSGTYSFATSASDNGKQYHAVWTNTKGSATSGVATITVNNNPAKPVITSNGSLSFCNGGNVTLTSSATTGNKWSTGEESQSIVATSSGSYTVTVQVNGCSAISDASIVTVNNSPAKPVITANGPLQFCADGSVTLTSSATTANKWNTGAETQSITVNTTGAYTVTYTDANGCSNTSDPVNVSQRKITASVTPGGTVSICTGSSVTLTANTGNGLRYKWLKDGTIIDGERNQTLTITKAGNYQVLESNDIGCTDISAKTKVVVANPTITVAPSGTINICKGTTITLTATSNAAGTYQWYKNSINTPISGATGSQLVVSSAGYYKVKIATESGCTGTSGWVIIKITTPTATISPIGPITICSGASTTLTANSSLTGTYQWYKWSNPIKNGTSAQLNVSSSAKYKVVIKSADGCTATSPQTKVTVSSPAATITPLGSLDICTTNSVTLQANDGTGLTYQWIKGSTPISGATNRNYTATATGTYKVKVTNSNGCSKTSSTAKVTKCAVTSSSTLITDKISDEMKSRLILSPNPSNGLIKVEFYSDMPEKVPVNVYDITGRVLFTEKKFANKGWNMFEFNFSSFASGMYYMQIANDRKDNAKFSIQK